MYSHKYVLDVTIHFLLKSNDLKMQPSLPDLLIALTIVGASLCSSFLLSKWVFKLVALRRMRRRERDLFRGRRTPKRRQ